jgi:hypothetical protein
VDPACGGLKRQKYAFAYEWRFIIPVNFSYCGGTASTSVYLQRQNWQVCGGSCGAGGFDLCFMVRATPSDLWFVFRRHPSRYRRRGAGGLIDPGRQAIQRGGL